MKKLLCLALLSSGLISANAATLTIVNHTSEKLNFKIDKGQDLVTLPQTFTLFPHESTAPIEVSGTLSYCEPLSATVFIEFHGDKNTEGFFGTGRGCQTLANQNMVYTNPDNGRNVAFSHFDGQNARITISE